MKHRPASRSTPASVAAGSAAAIALPAASQPMTRVTLRTLVAADVFQLRSTGGVIRPDACAAARPSSSTACGLFATIGNGLGYRVNPQLRPTRQIATKPSGSGGDQRIDPVDDPVALGAIWKGRRMWSGRSGVVATSTGVISGDAALTEGATFDYTLSNVSDALTRLRFDDSNTDADVKHTESCSDVAAAVSGRQRSADDALVIGDLFKCGSALAVLETRTPDNLLFSSDADNQPVGGGQTITARFRVVRAGTVTVTPAAEISPAGTSDIQYPPDVSASQNWDWSAVDPGPRYATGTSRGHLHRVAVADFTLARPARMVEIGLRSTVGIRGSGFANLRQILNLREINRLAGGEREGETLKAGDKLKVSTFQTGARSFSEERFAFFRLSYRAEAAAPFVLLPTLYGVRGLTQQAQFNSLQLEMPSSARWQFRLEPISGWEIRSGIATGQLAVLDAHLAGLRTVTDGAVVVRYVGEAPFTRSVERFALDSIEPDERSSVTALVTTTAAALAFSGPYTYTDVQLVQDGLDKGGRATIVVPENGGFNSSAITITAPGNGYDDGPITLVNGIRAGSAVIATRSFAVHLEHRVPAVRLTDWQPPSDVPPPRVGSLVSFASYRHVAGSAAGLAVVRGDGYYIECRVCGASDLPAAPTSRSQTLAPVTTPAANGRTAERSRRWIQRLIA
jgi:hypothetical protein